MNFGLQLNRSRSYAGDLLSDNHAVNPFTCLAVTGVLDAQFPLTSVDATAIMAQISGAGYPTTPFIIPTGAVPAFGGLAIINNSGRQPFKITSAFHRAVVGMFAFTAIPARLWAMWPNKALLSMFPIQQDMADIKMQGSTFFRLTSGIDAMNYESIDSVALTGEFQPIPGVTQKTRVMNSNFFGSVYASQELGLDRTVDFRNVTNALRTLGQSTPFTDPLAYRTMFPAIGDISNNLAQFISNWDVTFDEVGLTPSQLNETYLVISSAAWSINLTESVNTNPFNGNPAYAPPATAPKIGSSGDVYCIPISYLTSLGNLFKFGSTDVGDLSDNAGVILPGSYSGQNIVSMYPSTLKDPELYVGV